MALKASYFYLLGSFLPIDRFRKLKKKFFNSTYIGSTSGVGNSFGRAGHIRDMLGICGPKHVHTN